MWLANSNNYTWILKASWESRLQSHENECYIKIALFHYIYKTLRTEKQHYVRDNSLYPHTRRSTRLLSKNHFTNQTFVLLLPFRSLRLLSFIPRFWVLDSFRGREIIKYCIYFRHIWLRHDGKKPMLEDINNKSYGRKNPKATCDNHRRRR